ncbi:competence pheromone ComX [Paenibacillus sp. KN14-4R]|uniref:competence pheromone ComX n=1 Tax=Paenibacillus sp. KN14-4R TaxID=3445773 RepID=UPI003F9EE16A
MLKNIMNYLVGNQDVAKLVVNGQACLVGVSASQHRAIIEVIGNKDNQKVEPMKAYWNW